MNSAFYSNESDVLVRQVETSTEKESEWTSEEIDTYVKTSANWIKQNNFQKVCLQFPDCLLRYSTQISLALKKHVSAEIFVMADTTYESCCVDYVTAAHVNADAVIHFGEKCLSETSNELPCYYISPSRSLDVEQFLKDCRDEFQASNKVIVMLDLPYIHITEKLLQNELFTNGSYHLWNILKPNKIPEDVDSDKNCNVVFLSHSEKKFMHFYFVNNLDTLYTYSSSNKLQVYRPSARIISRRNFLIEKVKDAKTIGILVGTLAVKHYIKCIDRLKKLLKTNGKNYYVIHVGRPTIAKLANFPEVDAYVVIACPMSEIFDSRDFYQPIVTPYDVEMALNSSDSVNISFNPTCSAFIDKEISEISLDDTSDVSLITGKIRYVDKDVQNAEKVTGSQVSVRADGSLVDSNHFGGGFLAQRSWKGLEQNLGQTEVTLAREGIKGIAAQYENEGS